MDISKRKCGKICVWVHTYDLGVCVCVCIEKRYPERVINRKRKRIIIVVQVKAGSSSTSTSIQYKHWKRARTRKMCICLFVHSFSMPFFNQKSWMCVCVSEWIAIEKSTFSYRSSSATPCVSLFSFGIQSSFTCQCNTSNTYIVILHQVAAVAVVVFLGVRTFRLDR